jgi:hypothetical protein
MIDDSAAGRDHEPERAIFLPDPQESAVTKALGFAYHRRRK